MTPLQKSQQGRGSPGTGSDAIAALDIVFASSLRATARLNANQVHVGKARIMNCDKGPPPGQQEIMPYACAGALEQANTGKARHLTEVEHRLDATRPLPLSESFR